MSISLKLSAATEQVAAACTPRRMARSKRSSASAVVSWSTMSLPPVSWASARSRSRPMYSARAEAAGRPRRPASSPEVATAPRVRCRSFGRCAVHMSSPLA